MELPGSIMYNISVVFNITLKLTWIGHRTGLLNQSLLNCNLDLTLDMDSVWSDFIDIEIEIILRYNDKNVGEVRGLVSV